AAHRVVRTRRLRRVTRASGRALPYQRICTAALRRRPRTVYRPARRRGRGHAVRFGLGEQTYWDYDEERNWQRTRKNLHLLAGCPEAEDFRRLPSNGTVSDQSACRPNCPIEGDLR